MWNKTVFSVFLLEITFETHSWGQVCTPPPPQMVSWWPGDGNANDIQDGNSGTIVGGVTLAPGKVEQAFSIDGGREAVCRLGTLLTYSFKLLRSMLGSSGPSTTKASNNLGGGVIFGYGQNGYGFGLFEDGRLFLTQIGVSNVATGTLVVTDTAFHHVAVTHSNAGTGQTIFYVDGAVVFTFGGYNPTFTFTTNAAVGFRADSLSNSFLGWTRLKFSIEC